MEKRKVQVTKYFDSQEYYNISYEDYKEICEESEWPVREEGSKGYWEDIWHLTSSNWDDFRGNMQFNKFKGQRVMITGASGLWDGKHTIVPVLCDGIMEAIDKCISGNYDKEFEIEMNKDGYLDVTVHHHDGTNCYEIHLLSAKGNKAADKTIDRYEDFDPKPWWFKKMYGWLF